MYGLGLGEVDFSFGDDAGPEGFELFDEILEGFSFCATTALIDGIGIGPPGGELLAVGVFLGGAIHEAGACIHQQSGRGGIDEDYHRRRQTQGDDAERGGLIFGSKFRFNRIDQEHIGIQGGGGQTELAIGFQSFRQEQTIERRVATITNSKTTLYVIFMDTFAPSGL